MQQAAEAAKSIVPVCNRRCRFDRRSSPDLLNCSARTEMSFLHHNRLRNILYIYIYIYIKYCVVYYDEETTSQFARSNSTNLATNAYRNGIVDYRRERWIWRLRRPAAFALVALPDDAFGLFLLSFAKTAPRDFTTFFDDKTFHVSFASSIAYASHASARSPRIRYFVKAYPPLGILMKKFAARKEATSISSMGTISSIMPTERASLRSSMEALVRYLVAFPWPISLSITLHQ
mmetsp:Transcript_45759/g.76224  ORF Transcript_45759/g.76224 Transcript_45759/m.76224 type:complete len:233 (+) Transcript_45759:848-1546(+)